MFGREAERARIERMLDCAGSAPVGLALEGVPGIGKTTLWREGLDSARERAYRVLVTAPAEPDAALGFAGLGDLFEGILDELGSRLPTPNAMRWPRLSRLRPRQRNRRIRWSYGGRS